MKRIIYIVSVILFATSTYTYAQDVLDGYLITAAENNSGLKAKFNEYHAALEKIPQVGALPDPTISFGYFIQPVETKVGPQQAKVSVNQMFPWFGTLDAMENSTKLFAKAKYELFEEVKSRLFYDVKSTYYNLYFIQKAIGITTENIEILVSFKNLANIKVESGSASVADAYRVEIELNDLKYQLALLEDNLRLQSIKFNNLLNVEDNHPITIVDSLVTKEIGIPKEVILSSIAKNNNVLVGYDYQIESLLFKEEATTKAGMPKISIGFDYTIIGNAENAVANSGQDAIMFPKVGLTVPIYRKKYKAMVQEVIYLQQAKKDEQQDKQNMLETMLESTWRDYQDASRRIRLYTEQIVLARKSLTVLESHYSVSHDGFEEILRMERMLLQYSLEQQKALADKAAAIAFINYLQGN